MDNGGPDITWLIGLDDLELKGVLSRLVSCFADRGGALLRDEVEQSRGMDPRPAQQALARLRQELP